MSRQSVPHLLYPNKPSRMPFKQVICILRHELLKANIWPNLQHLNFLKCCLFFLSKPAFAQQQYEEAVQQVAYWYALEVYISALILQKEIDETS